jgi:signal transduction histidine kinase
MDLKPNFQILFSNRSARLFLGYENASLGSLSLQELTPQYGRLLEILKLKKKHVEVLKFPLEFLHKEGYPLASEVMIISSGNCEERILLYIWDIRRLRKREKRFRQKLQRTEKVSQAKSIFVSLVSHEFRTPMASIRAASDLLKNYWERFSQEECKEYLRQIGSNIFQMSRMMDDILLLGRIQNGRLRFETSLIDPLELCHEAIQFVQVYGEKSRIVMVVSENLPSKCSIDPSLFRYVLINLLSNALKYSPQTEKVILTLCCDQDFLVLEVKDKGIGIPEKDRGKIFHLFHRGENVGSIKGIGVGMFMVKYCVSLHKGSIAFKPNAGAGTTFRVKLPAACQAKGG